MPPSEPKVIRAVRPNTGVRFRYQRRMMTLIDEMNLSTVHWLQAQYRDTPPTLAEDASPTPSKAMQRKFREVAKQWRERFEAAAPKIAEAYVKGSFKATDSAMRAALKDAGLSVKFTMNAAMRDAFNASLEENIGLIKSIPERYFQDVQGIVARAYASGRDLETMVKELRKIHPITQRRAILIARDQSNKANSVVENARRLQIGITQAIWMHSGGGKHPRPEHVKATGRVYNIREGCPIAGRKIQPGQEINCRCVSRSVIPGLAA